MTKVRLARRLSARVEIWSIRLSDGYGIAVFEDGKIFDAATAPRGRGWERCVICSEVWRWMSHSARRLAREHQLLADLEDTVFTALDEARHDLAEVGLIARRPDEGEASRWLCSIAEYAEIPSSREEPQIPALLDRWLSAKLTEVLQ